MLAKVDRIARQIAQITDRAEAIRVYARQQKACRRIERQAVVIRLQAERQIGLPELSTCFDSHKADKLQARIRMICRRYGEELDDAAPADDAKFVHLQNELVDHTEKLFVFVLHPEVEAT